MGLLRKRLVLPKDSTVAAHTARKAVARETRNERQPKPVFTWWVIAQCPDVSCNKEPKAHVCQICRRCVAHCLGHRGILDGLRAVLTVHRYD